MSGTFQIRATIPQCILRLFTFAGVTEQDVRCLMKQSLKRERVKRRNCNGPTAGKPHHVSIASIKGSLSHVQRR